jgi:site-specific DNA recombinase
VSTIESEVRKTDAAIEKYLLAFEGGTLSETQLGPRVQALGAKMADLRRRREDLIAEGTPTAVQAPTDAELARLRGHVPEQIISGAVAAKKVLLQSLVDRVVVDGRDTITPWFRVPAQPAGDGDGAKVRALATMAGERRFEPRICA